MKYSAKAFLDFIFESHHDVDSIWQMKDDVFFFVNKMITMLGGYLTYTPENIFKESGKGKRRRTRRIGEKTYFDVMGARMGTFEINGHKFGLVRRESSPNQAGMHRTEFFLVARPDEIDQILKSDWEPIVELEDAKRLFILKRKVIKDPNQDVYRECFPGMGANEVNSRLMRSIGIDDMVVRKIQLGWRATLKYGKVPTSKELLTDQPEWKEVMGFGCEFCSTDEMLKNGTLAFKIPTWAVEDYQQNFKVRIEYDKKNLDFVGRFVIGRKDSVIRWWDWFTNQSKRMDWSPGNHINTLEQYRGALSTLARIMRNQLVNTNFRFKEGWEPQSLDDARVNNAVNNTLDDLW
jgi:hypothetical protein